MKNSKFIILASVFVVLLSVFFFVVFLTLNAWVYSGLSLVTTAMGVCVFLLQFVEDYQEDIEDG